MTRFMMPFLEGDSQMLWVCNISPTDAHYRANKRTLDFANKVVAITQMVKDTQVYLEETTLFQVKRKIATLKLRLSKLEIHI